MNSEEEVNFKVFYVYAYIQVVAVVVRHIMDLTFFLQFVVASRYVRVRADVFVRLYD